MAGRGRCAKKRIEHTAAHLLRCPRSPVPEVMRACKFSDKGSTDARKQMAVHRADNNATTNQQRDQQKWAVVVAAIATVMAAATMATQQRDSNAMKTVMDGDGWCTSNTTVTTAMEGLTATQGRCNGNSTAMEDDDDDDGRHDGDRDGDGGDDDGDGDGNGNGNGNGNGDGNRRHSSDGNGRRDGMVCGLG